MKHREAVFSVIMAIVLLATPLVADAQQSGKVSTIGYLSQSSGPAGPPSPQLTGFQIGLRELGYVEGKNIAIEYRFTEGKSGRLPKLAAELARLMASIYLFVAGGRHYSLSQFLGIHHMKTGISGRALSEYDTFNTSGILSAIRHPWYGAGILILWARDISLSILLNNIVISAYFVIGAFLEEKKLLIKFGEKFREYQKNVSMFIPYKWVKT